MGEHDVQSTDVSRSEPPAVEDFYEDGRSYRKLKIIWWLCALLGALQVGAGRAEGSVLVTAVAVLMVIVGLVGIVLMRRAENAAQRTPLTRITEEALRVRRPASAVLEAVAWSRIECIAWAGDDLGLRLRAEGDDAFGDTLLVSWSGLQKAERRRLRRAIEERLAESPAA